MQGPPGTGKTRTLARLLAAATTVMPRGQIMAAAASNVAVDNLVMCLLALGIKVIRVGQPVRVSFAQPIGLRHNKKLHVFFLCVDVCMYNVSALQLRLPKMV